MLTCHTVNNYLVKMVDPLKRRDFIKTVSLAGASLAVSPHVAAKAFIPKNNVTEIKNEYFTVSFDQKGGTINIDRSDGRSLLRGATVCVNKHPAQNNPSPKRSIASGAYRHALHSIAFSDPLGTGTRLIISSKDHNKELDLEIQLSLYEGLELATIEVICKNVSSRDLVIDSIEPLRAIKDEGGILNVRGVSKCITNGEMYYDAGTLHEFGNRDDAISSGDLKGVKMANGPISSGSETIHSWWNAGFFSGYDTESVVMGYLENNLCLGNLLISKTAPDQVSFLAESVYAPKIDLRPGKEISSNRFMISLGPNPYLALERYAKAAGTVNHARTHSIINGWCSWFYTLSNVSEDEVVTNSAFASKYLSYFGLEYIQIDEGYQRWHGDWEGNARFPHGMKWLADRIKSYGLKAGLWISPYVISEPTEVFQKHPEWLLKNADGSPKRVGNWEQGEEPPADEYPKRYCLDITHPEAAKWLYDLIDTIVNEWGYEMIKIDFVAWSILAADHYYDPTVSSAQVYRKGLEIMRNAAGQKCHILDCGPSEITVGLIDSMRIEADVNYGFSEAAWETYFLHPACSAAAAARRYYFHKRTRINDADHICMSLLNNQQAEAAASLIALSGGNMISGDRLTQLDAYKLEVLKKITPSFGEAAVPVDLFDSNIPSAFAMKIKKPFAGWTIAAFFNSSLDQTAEKKFSMTRLWLDPGKTYLAFDFWKQQFVGEISGELKLTLQPGSVTLLTLHEKTGKPQFISTDRHVIQGGIEINNVTWNEETKTISGISGGPLTSSHNVFVYVPEEHPWTWGGSARYRDYDSYSLKLVDKNIVQVSVRFEKTDHVEWEIETNEFRN